MSVENTAGAGALTIQINVDTPYFGLIVVQHDNDNDKSQTEGFITIERF